ncbi:hypothetical protein GYMLUDRAFT_252053 [Collybiopsis luxurians FD-317 M1]|uniref:Xylanolytic transcriptional activator regulatory domain-containing protein n=1 Tax=Collybiopsis luxurians FD-317 M1 TaxID=944289 RepID=A0A0D0C156_9AGAR|nr:hypothetical protein GYMLUDRAFT_252053 [Collybiopsis luxurians FD-317 M1]
MSSDIYAQDSPQSTYAIAQQRKGPPLSADLSLLVVTFWPVTRSPVARAVRVENPAKPVPKPSYTNDPEVSRAKLQKAARARLQRDGSNAPSTPESVDSNRSQMSASDASSPTSTSADSGYSLTLMQAVSLAPTSPNQSLTEFDQEVAEGQIPSSIDGHLASFSSEFIETWMQCASAASIESGASTEVIPNLVDQPSHTTETDTNANENPFNVTLLDPFTSGPLDFIKLKDPDQSMVTPTNMASPASTMPLLQQPFSLADIPPAANLERAVKHQLAHGTEAELRIYMHFFFSSFSLKIPIIHEATWIEKDRPLALLTVMQACGALYVRTKQAKGFIRHTLMFNTSPQCDSVDPNTQIDLIFALGLLQCLAIFSKQKERRTASALYHGMMKQMIARSGVLQVIQSWKSPEFFDETPVDEAWHSWARYESVKRLCCLTHLQACDFIIFFAIPPYTQHAIEGTLPCDDELWRALTAQDWVTSLRATSQYGSPTVRLHGANAQAAIGSLYSQFATLTPPLSRITEFAQYLLIHEILSRLFLGSYIHATTAATMPDMLLGGKSALENICSYHQNALKNWFVSWQKGQGSSIHGSWASDSLCYYRLAQLTLQLLREESLPLLTLQDYRPEAEELRFQVLRRWLHLVRGSQQIEQLDISLMQEDTTKMQQLYKSLEATTTETSTDRAETEDINGFLGVFIQ